MLGSSQSPQVSGRQILWAQGGVPASSLGGGSAIIRVGDTSAALALWQDRTTAEG